MKIFNFIIFYLCLTTLYGQNNVLTSNNSEQASAILSQVRYAYPKKTLNFKGEIRPRKIGFKMIPVNISFNDQMIRFEFYKENKSSNDKDEIINLQFGDDRIKVFREFENEITQLNDNQLGERIRGTDIAYDDIAMRFLKWPKPVILKIEKAKGGMAWKIRCTNPNKNQLYSIVDVWVSQKSGAIVRMNAYNNKRRIIKSFEVDAVQQIKGDWFLETMIVRSYPIDAGSKPTSSFLKLEPIK